MDDEKRPKSRRNDVLLSVGRLDNRQDLSPEIFDEKKATIHGTRGRIGDLQPIERVKLIARRGLDGDVAATVVEGHREPIVRQHLVGDLGHARKDGADVEHVGDRPKQLNRAFQVRGAIALERGAPGRLSQPLMRKRHRDVFGDPLREDQVALRVGVAAP
jgi:hypothetical protein